MVDVVDEAVVVAVGHRAGRRRAGLAAGVLVLVVLDERDVGVDAVEVGLAAVGVRQGDPLVDEVDPQALVEEGVLLEPGPDRLVVVVDRLEDVGVGPVGDGGAGAVGLLHLLQGADGHAVVEGHPEGVALLAHADVEPGRQGVDDRGADAVQATGDLVAAAAELAAGVQLGEHELDGADALGRVHVGGDAAPVVLDPDRAVLHERDVDGVGVPGERLVDRVVDDLPHEVVQAALAGGADVHAGPLAHRLEALEDGDGGGVVGRALTLGDRDRDRLGGHGGRLGGLVGGQVGLLVRHGSPSSAGSRRGDRRDTWRAPKGDERLGRECCLHPTGRHRQDMPRGGPCGHLPADWDLPRPPTRDPAPQDP